MLRLLEAIVIVLVVLWLAGLVLHLLGGLIHILLVVALVVLVFRFLQGRSAS